MLMGFQFGNLKNGNSINDIPTVKPRNYLNIKNETSWTARNYFLDASL